MDIDVFESWSMVCWLVAIWHSFEGYLQ